MRQVDVQVVTLSGSHKVSLVVLLLLGGKHNFTKHTAAATEEALDGWR